MNWIRGNDILSHKRKYKILIYGAGVIGSILAVHFSKNGNDVHVYARNDRLEVLEEKGLLYEEEGKVVKARVTVDSNVSDGDYYDYIFVTVRRNQILNALSELKNNISLNIVTMVNNIEGYTAFGEILGQGRLIPAFPGAGGKIEKGFLRYSLVPSFIQKTTFGELNGKTSKRVVVLLKLFRSSGIPCEISRNMEAWQKCHVAFITALELGIYSYGETSKEVAKHNDQLIEIVQSLNRNFKVISEAGFTIEPQNLRVFYHLPLKIQRDILKKLFKTKFAEGALASGSKKSKEEMGKLQSELLSMKFPQ